MPVPMVDPDGNDWPADSEAEALTLEMQGYKRAGATPEQAPVGERPADGATEDPAPVS